MVRRLELNGMPALRSRAGTRVPEITGRRKGSQFGRVHTFSIGSGWARALRRSEEKPRRELKLLLIQRRLGKSVQEIFAAARMHGDHFAGKAQPVEMLPGEAGRDGIAILAHHTGGGGRMA